MPNDPNARETPQPGQSGVPLQPPRQGDVDTGRSSNRPPPTQPPDAEETKRRAEERERRDAGSEPPRYDRRGHLTRHGMECAIRGGGVVSHRGKTLARVEDLPTDAELAEGDAEAAERVRQGLDDQIAKLVAEKQKLSAPPRAAADRADPLSDPEREELERLRREAAGREGGPAADVAGASDQPGASPPAEGRAEQQRRAEKDRGQPPKK